MPRPISYSHKANARKTCAWISVVLRLCVAYAANLLVTNQMEVKFDGKRALVTGAGKGIGRAIAIALAKGGADVFALSRTQADLDSLQQESTKISCRLIELSDWEATKKVVEDIGPIDLLVNNAGISILESFLDVTPDAFEKIFSVNLRAALQVSQICARGMIERGVAGSIVNVSSIASQAPIKNHTCYCSSKAALDMMSKVMALELGPKKIRVNCVNPVVTNTDMAVYAWSDPIKSGPFLARIPLGKFAEVEDVVNTVLYLLSDKAAMINGATVPIDGGFLMTGI